MRSSLRFLLSIAAVSSLLAIVPAAASADDTLGGLIGTTDLIGILGGISLPQISVPGVTDPTATDPTQTGTTTPTYPTGTTTTPATTPTTQQTNPAPTQQSTPQPPTTHGFGYYCKGETKHHVHGQKRTPFSQCVTAMAKLKKGSASSAAAACRGLSRRHVKGARSTPYALCTAGGRKLLADLPK